MNDKPQLFKKFIPLGVSNPNLELIAVSPDIPDPTGIVRERAGFVSYNDEFATLSTLDGVLFMFKVKKKVLPASVLKKETLSWLKQHARVNGYTSITQIPKKVVKEIKYDCEFALLETALVDERLIRVFITTNKNTNNFMLVEDTQPKTAEFISTLLRLFNINTTLFPDWAKEFLPQVYHYKDNNVEPFGACKLVDKVDGKMSVTFKEFELSEPFFEKWDADGFELDKVTVSITEGTRELVVCTIDNKGAFSAIEYGDVVIESRDHIAIQQEQMAIMNDVIGSVLSVVGHGVVNL